MKRTLTSVIALMLFLLMLVPQTIFSATAANPTISASNVEANPGDTVDVTVNIANNPGVTSVLLTIGYDSSVLTLTSVTDGGILGSAFHSNNYKNPYTLSWANDTATTNITNNGTAVTLKFKVADNATIKKYSITVSYDVDNYEVIDKDMNPISFGLVNGSIDVKAAACKHTDTTNVAAKASTCKTQGNNAYTRCNDCGVVVSGSDAKLPLGNCSFSAWITTTSATCTAAGKHTRTCSVCGKSETKDIAALGHNYSTSYTVDTAATCETAGSKSQHCSRCSSTQNVTAIPATGHNYTSKVTTAATCDKAGVKTFTCSKCSDSYTESIAATGHNYTSKVTTAATCDKAGVKTFTCSKCSKSYTEAIAALGHNYSTSYTVDKEATCTTAGSKSQHCTRCSSTQNVTAIPATGHSYTSKVTTPATHTSTGVMTYTCACGKSYTEVIEKITTHSHNAAVTAPTCTEQGYTTYTCSCGDSYIADYVPAKGHTEGNWVVTTPATATQTGIKTLYCSGCGIELKTETIPVVKGKVHSVTVSDVSVYYKDSTTITPSIKVDSGVKYTVTYSSSNSSVASVDANGKVTTGDRGETTITVTVTDEYGNTVKDTCNVKVEYKWWQWIIVIVLFGWIWY